MQLMSDIAPIKDLENPRSVASIVTPTLQKLILDLDESYFGHDELEYEKEIAQWHITQTDKRLRMSFWLEYDRAQANQVRMEMKRIWSGACSEDCFYRLIKNPVKLGYYLIPPKSYTLACQELLDRAGTILGQYLMEVLSKGKWSAKEIEVVSKIYALMDARVHGAVVQRVEQKNLNLNVETNKPEMSLDEVKKRLIEIEKKPIDQILEAKEVEVEDVQ